MDPSAYRGPAVFGPAYRRMFESDSHAPGSVDRALLDEMVLLCKGTRRALYGALTPTEIGSRPGAAPQLEAVVAEVTARTQTPEERVEAIARFTSGLAARADGIAVDDILLGGREEQIAARPTDWCTDLARLACTLCQVSGIPARLVTLADTSRAYCGHEMIEAHRNGAWGAVCPTTNVVYRHPDTSPASAWDLQRAPSLVETHARGGETPYTEPGMFRAVAIADNFVWERDRYSYATSLVNAYQRSILTMAERGWPNGLRWLHGEDGAAPPVAP